MNRPPAPGQRMVPLVLAAALAAGSLPAGPAPAPAAPIVLRHDLIVSLHPDNGALSATDTLTIRSEGADRVSLALHPDAVVTHLAVNGRELPLASSPFPQGVLGVPVPPEARAGTMTVAVAYSAAFRDPVSEDPVGTEDPSYGVRGTITPRGAFLSGGARWYPEIVGSASAFRIRVDAPEGFEAITAGKRLRRATEGGRSVSEWEIRIPVEGLALSAGRYVVRESAAGGVAIYTYFSPENLPLAERYLEATARYLDLYNGLFGPYPFEKFAVVENFFPTGYGFPSWTLLGSTVVRLPFIVETSLGHEIAHSWWGNGVLVDDERGNWSEGLTTYVADHLFLERASAERAREYRLKLLRDFSVLVPPEKDFPLRRFGARVDPATRAVGYGKAAMVFHMARRLAGEEAFWQGLRDVARDRFGKAASWSDFAAAFERHGASGLSSFFSQWVDRAGAPTIALRDVEARREEKGWTVTGRLIQQMPAYELRVPLRLATDGEPEEAVIPLSGEEARFALRSRARPRKLVVDPEADLFRRLAPPEIPSTVNGLKGSRSLLVVSARGVSPETIEAAKVLLLSMGHGGARVLREEETAPALLAGRDVLFIGLPRGEGLLPPLPEGLEVTGTAFVLKGRRYDAPGDSLFAALPHPTEAGRVAALFLALSPGAASAAARKITHYGTYSYLAFSDGTNREKGTWEPASSPAVHLFPAERGGAP